MLNVTTLKANKNTDMLTYAQAKEHLLKSSRTAFVLFQRDLATSGARSFLGLGWDFINPLIIAFFFWLLFQARSLNFESGGLPFGIYLIVGVVAWQQFAISLMQSVSLIKRARVIMGSIPVQATTLMLKELLSGFYGLGFRIVIIIGFAILGRQAFSIDMLLAIVPLSFLLLLALSVGFFMSAFNIIASDTEEIAKIGLLGLFYFSGVIFPLDQIGSIGEVLGRLPAAMLMEIMRARLSGGEVSLVTELSLYAGITMFFLVATYVCVIGVRFMRRG